MLQQGPSIATLDRTGNPVNRKVVGYSALFITAAINMPRLLAMNPDGVLGRIAPFHIGPWVMQLLVSFFFCLLLFYLNKDHLLSYSQSWQWNKHGRLLLYNVGITLGCAIVAGVVSRIAFGREGVGKLNGYVFRLGFVAALVAIELKIVSTLYKAQLKDKENEQLRHANMQMELSLLKAQLNPHFFFNALSSLSGVVRESPAKAQEYIAHLSRIFRYSLHPSRKNLVTLEEELTEIHAYSELMKMRLEEGFTFETDVAPALRMAQLPHMALQPLVENALKHNLATRSQPLTIRIYTSEQHLIVANNLQLKPYPEPGTGTGLANLAERFHLLLGQEISISQLEGSFLVTLPLKILPA